MAPLRCGRQSFTRGSQQRAFSTREYAIVWLESGQARVCYAGREPVALRAGDAFKRLPGQPHDVFFDGDGVSWFLAVPGCVCELMALCGLPAWEEVRIHPGGGRAIAAGFASLRDDLLRVAGAERMRCLARMQAFIAELHQRSVMADPRQATIAEACSLLRQQPELTVPAVAERCGLAYASFRLRFHAVMGCSPRDYRIRLRIEQAQALLLEDLSLGEIAERLGYCDAFRFSAQFRQVTGLSPSHWRRRETGRG
jgi:AraC-like DNA-binding protein